MSSTTSASHVTTDVILVGCGAPYKSMGSVHFRQLIYEPDLNARTNVVAVVEPFFMNERNATEAQLSGFSEFKDRIAETHPEVAFAQSLADIPPRTHAGDRPCVLFIACRTLDIPMHIDTLLNNQSKLQVTHVFLEKPGAPTAAELRVVQTKLESIGAAVCVGYNKCVAQYADLAVKKARSAKGGRPDVELIHHNDYTPADLPEVFSRCAEGMLKNQTCHEISLMVSIFGMRAEHVRAPGAVEVLPEGTRLECHAGFTDFSSLSFRVAMPERAADDTTYPDVRSITCSSTRCGGDWSGIDVHLPGAPKAEEFLWPAPHERDDIQIMLEEEPDMRSILAVAYSTYVEYKRRLFPHVEADFLARKAGGAPIPFPVGLSSVTEAVEVLEIAETLEPMLKSKALEMDCASPGVTV